MRYIATESVSSGHYAIPNLLTQRCGHVQYDQSALLGEIPFATEISSLNQDSVHSHLPHLSDDAQMLIASKRRNAHINCLDRAPLALSLSSPQPDAVTITTNGAVYIVSKPSLLPVTDFPSRTQTICNRFLISGRTEHYR